MSKLSKSCAPPEMTAGLLLSLERQTVGGPATCSGRPPSLCTPGSRHTTPPELTTACSESPVAMVRVQGAFGGGANRTIQPDDPAAGACRLYTP